MGTKTNRKDATHCVSTAIEDYKIRASKIIEDAINNDIPNAIIIAPITVPLPSKIACFTPLFTNISFTKKTIYYNYL